jgi:hypothetical protein
MASSVRWQGDKGSVRRALLQTRLKHCGPFLMNLESFDGLDVSQREGRIAG